MSQTNINSDFVKSETTSLLIHPNEKKNWKLLLKACLGEFLGTYLLVFIGCGAIVANNAQNTSVAFAFGFLLIAIVHAFKDISGSHFNPSVSLALLLAKQITLARFGLYFISQFSGSILASIALYYLVPNSMEYYLGSTQLQGKVTPLQGTFIEAISTATLVLVVFCTDVESKRSKESKLMIPIVVGSIITALVIFAGPLTNCSLNSARSFGPALISGMWNDHWVYWVGPLSGGVFGSFLFYLLSL